MAKHNLSWVRCAGIYPGDCGGISIWEHDGEETSFLIENGDAAMLTDEDAKLFAAAPDLLEACETAVRRLDFYAPESPSNPLRQLLDTLRAAIAKAKGDA